MKFTLNSALALVASALFLFALVGCVPTKPSVSLSGESDEEGYFGEVTTKFAKDGCPILIQYKEGTELKYLIPVQLDEQFKKNGLKVNFTFHYSRIAQGECQIGQPAVLEEIKLLD
ncbi:MAG: hypothetical protein K9J17_13760 [Flavobacteriales bacterium]|nr:hypothetical protein [Flavobacteriales bacterium]